MLLSQSGQFGPEAFHLLLKQRENGKREWSSPKREREEGQNIIRASVMSVAQGQGLCTHDLSHELRIRNEF